jgi:hypothetical protein
MPTNLLDQTVESTYEGVLHAEGAALPLIGLQTIYDGSGQASALAMGISGNGIQVSGGLSISGKLSAGVLEFTNVDSVSGEGFPLVTDGNGNVDFGQIVIEALPDMDPNPDGSYSQIDTINVNSKGLVEQIFLSPIRQCWVNFDGKPITGITYTIDAGASGGVVNCTKVNHGLATGQIISLTASDVILNGDYPVTKGDANNFSFPLPNVTAVSGTLGINTVIRSAYNVKSVARVGAGKYTINFNDTFNNNMYMTQVTKGSHLNPAANPATPATGDNGWAIVLSQNAQNVNVFSQNGDCTNMNVFVVGNTLIYENDEPQLFYTNYRYRNLYFNQEVGETGSCTVDSGFQTYTIDPAYMAANKLIAVEIATRGLDHCRVGYSNVYANNSVTDINGNIYNSSFIRTTNYEKKYGQSESNAYGVTTFIAYIDNQLYYKNFYTSQVTATASFSAVDVKTSDANIPPKILNRRASYCTKNASGSGTSTSYFTDILTKYGLQPANATGFIRIQTATISTRLIAKHNGECGGGLRGEKYIKEYYIT